VSSTCLKPKSGFVQTFCPSVTASAVICYAGFVVTTKNEDTIFFRVAWSIRSDLPVVKHEQQEIYFQSNLANVEIIPFVVSPSTSSGQACRTMNGLFTLRQAQGERLKPYFRDNDIPTADNCLSPSLLLSPARGERD
jgi:hypothetical protein